MFHRNSARLLVPFLGRSARAGRVRTVVGGVACAYVVGMTAWGYRSWVPVAVLLAAGATMAPLAWGTRPRGQEKP